MHVIPETGLIQRVAFCAGDMNASVARCAQIKKEEEVPARPRPAADAEELQAELAAFKANQASTSKATSDKAKGRHFNKKAKHADNNKGGRAPEGSVEEARRQAEYHRRKAQEADALLAEREK
uniref:Uncharacterized protein n=1 Tax=Dunaliella viridis TaxID=140095 RepID=D1FV78_9CHLO|nr:hypothetical protein [Dunaliella viridis]